MQQTTGSFTSECSYSASVRQSNSSSLHTERRRYEISETIQSDLRTSTSNRQPEHNSVSILSTREIQQYSRSIVTQNSYSRIALTTYSHRKDLQKMGRSRYRSIRVKKFSNCQNLCQFRPSFTSSLCLAAYLLVPLGKSYRDTFD